MTDLKKPEQPEAALTAAQLTAIPILAAGSLKKDAATVANVTPQTISTWLGQPQFQAALDAARQDLSSAASIALRDATDAAVATILDLLRHGSSEATRLKAACYVLDRVLAIRTVEELPESTNSQVDMRKLMDAIGSGPQ